MFNIISMLLFVFVVFFITWRVTHSNAMAAATGLSLIAILIYGLYAYSMVMMESYINNIF